METKVSKENMFCHKREHLYNTHGNRGGGLFYFFDVDDF